MKRKIKTNLSKREYKKFMGKLLEYNKNNGQLPNQIELNECEVFKNEYIDTIEQVNKFILENGRYPEVVPIYVKHN